MPSGVFVPGDAYEGDHTLDPPLPLVWFDECAPALDSTDFVEDLLVSEQMSVVYGESGCGKTFFSLDLALHVAAGEHWRGRDVTPGGVLYLALEGSHGIRNRVCAFRDVKKWNARELPFAIVPVGVNLLNPAADTSRVIDTVNAAMNRMSVPITFIVVDTLSRALAGVNENSPEDMSTLVMNCDRIRQTVKAHLQLVHHSGKDSDRGARGHSLLRAATDTEIEVSRIAGRGLSVARLTKQKDLPGGDEFAFRLQSVELGTNRRGKMVTSCVVTEADVVDTGPKLFGDQQTANSILVEIIAHDGQVGFPGLPAGVRSVPLGSWRSAFYRRAKPTATADTKRKAFSRAVESLVATGRVSTLDDRVWTV